MCLREEDDDGGCKNFNPSPSSWSPGALSGGGQDEGILNRNGGASSAVTRFGSPVCLSAPMLRPCLRIVRVVPVIRIGSREICGLGDGLIVLRVSLFYLNWLASISALKRSFVDKYYYTYMYNLQFVRN